MMQIAKIKFSDAELDVIDMKYTVDSIRRFTEREAYVYKYSKLKESIQKDDPGAQSIIDEVKYCYEKSRIGDTIQSNYYLAYSTLRMKINGEIEIQKLNEVFAPNFIFAPDSPKAEKMASDIKAGKKVDLSY